MADEDRTEPSAPAASVVAGEADLPLEHTARVRAAREGQTPPTQLRVHDGAPTEAGPRSSTERSERARRERRRERDRRAEKRAIALVVSGLLVLGGGALFAVNYLMEDPAPTAPVAVEGEAGPEPQAGLTPPPRPGVITTPLEETPDLPVLRFLRQEGLTIGAEGLPETLALGAGPGPQRAAMESCRFAYGVWELSPNRRFRFLTTCRAFEGQVLFGAYEVTGTTVKMSPLAAGGVSLVTELGLEKPTKARTRVVDGTGAPVLEVRQRLTAIRQGLDGEAFREAFAGRNTLTPRGAGAPPGAARAPPAAAAPPPPAERDPVLDLLQGQ